MATVKSGFAKYRTCVRIVYTLGLIGLLVCFAQWFLVGHIEQVGLGWSYMTLRCLWALFMLLQTICIVLCMLMIRYTKCPRCGKSVLSKWWNYDRGKRIMKCERIHCPHCEAEIETK